ncbi:MAG: hypothetical protein MJ060_02495 [Clostridia bacterium]|nr:hypothetical protein [Clostridia bacterium]
MLFSYELKKILRRVSPLLVLIVLALTTVATMLLTTIFFQQTPTTNPDVTIEYTALQTKINNWDTTFNRNDLADAFDEFYDDYKSMNASTLFDSVDKLVDNYNTAKKSFLHFYLDYYSNPSYGIQQNVNNYLLIRTKYIDNFNDILTQLNHFFDLISPTENTITDRLKATNAAWDDASLHNLFFIQEINDEDLTKLQDFFATYPADQDGYDYTNAYNYALNRFWIAVANSSTYKGELAEYKGFEDYQDVATSTRACKLAKYQLEHKNEEFAMPFKFGKIYNHSQQISLFDFVFTNMEMAMLPLTLLVMIWAVCTFSTDDAHGTLITAVAAGKKRFTVILTKIAVVLTLTILTLLLLSAVYITSGLIFFEAYFSPDILCLFNGTKIMILSSTGYFVLYILNLIFKLLPLIAICGLFTFINNKTFVIVSFATLICVAFILTNFFLGRFSFYQYIPLMGLDPIRYFGAELLFAPMPNTYNLWYTFPAAVAITTILYWSLIHIFRHHDF